MQSQASQHQASEQTIVQPQAPSTSLDPVPTRPGPGTWKTDGVQSGLKKALDALFQAQDHLNAASDRGGDGLSKLIDGINGNLRGVQRELTQVIYRLGRGG